MEAVPRLPMVCFELRTPTDSASFGPKLKEYIRDFYNEDPETYSHEINQLESLRAAAVRPGRDINGVANLKRYYCQLHFLMSRFPMAKDGIAAVQFSWRDAYVGMSFSVADIRYEISSILYNIGALHTQLGMADTRTTEDGMKMACTHFQCAAWAFQHLKDSYPPTTEADLAPDIMQFAYHLCLAQAQECILEKSMMDNRKASIIVKVAVQVVNYYSQAFNALKQSVSEEAVGTKVYSGWRRLAKFKEIYYRCVIQLFQGMQAEEQQKMGERVAFYQLAHDTLEEAIKLSKNLEKAEMNPKQVQEALSFTQDVVEGKRKAAKNENEFIYHEEVPDRDQLPKAVGVSLVKGIPFSINDSEVSGPDIFGRLVPMKAHEASSLYSEEKAKLLRKVGGSIDEKDQQLTSFLSSLQLEYLHCYSEPDQLPQELVDRCAALSAKPDAIERLLDSMSRLSEICIEVESMLKEIKMLLEEEERLEKEYQAIMGNRPPSIIATDMTREANKYQEAHAKANESNQALYKVMASHISNLRILSLPLSQLKQQIPPPPSLSDPESESIVKEMQGLMEKVEEMRNQRALLTSQLRDSICNDDITQLLVTNPTESLDSLFQEELKKHQDVVKLLQQNLSAQENILRAVTDAYARYSNVRKSTAEAMRKRQSVINALITCFDAYEDLLAKSSKGHEFYNILETNVSKLLGRVKSTCRVQQEEREQMLLTNKSVLPPKIQNKAAIVPEQANNILKGQTAPKLKDYLKNNSGLPTGMRGSGNFSSSDVQVVSYSSNGLYGQPTEVVPNHPAVYFDPSTNNTGSGAKMSADSQASQWMPGIRPAPLGSEATTSVLKSEPIDFKTVPTTSQSQVVSCNPAAQQVYNYAGTWGYGSQATTMSTYLPTNVQYSVDPKPGNISAIQPAYQLNNFTTTEGHRFGPVGGTSYQSGNTEPSEVGFPYHDIEHTISANYRNEPKVPPSEGNDIAAQPRSYQPPMYENYNPVIMTSVSSQYGVQNTPANYQSAPGYDLNISSAAGTFQNVSGYNEHVPGDTYYGNVPNNANPFAHPFPQLVSGYGEQLHSFRQNYSNMAGTSSGQLMVNYQNLGSPATDSTASQSVPDYPRAQEGVISQQLSRYQILNQATPSPVVGQSCYQDPNAAVVSQPLPDHQDQLSSTTANQLSGYQYTPAVAVGQPLTNYQNSSSQTNTFSCDQQYPNLWPSNVSSSLPMNQIYGHHCSDSTLASHYQYMDSQNVSSYSNAGTFPTSQTSSSYCSQVQTLGYQSGTNGAIDNYYQAPHYGSQNHQNANQAGPVAQASVVSYSDNSIHSTQGMYIQARMPKSDSYTTDSPKASKSSHSENISQSSSNVDLLAGLDFSISQQPLLPQQGEPKSVIVTENITSIHASQNSSTSCSAVIPLESEIPKQSQGLDISTDALIDSMSSLKIPGESSVKLSHSKLPAKDPFLDQDYLHQFTQEVEKYEKFVEGLTLKTLNGPTSLDLKWKEVNELQEKDSHQRSISVARCYPMKNRFPDILPYDCSRVELPSTKDDYINASHLRDLTPSTPSFILTQLPLPSTYNDFWIMVHEQQVEVVVCLLNDMELERQRYWPAEKNQDMAVGRMQLNLQTENIKQHWTERIISVYDVETRLSRNIVHLQLTGWPGSSFPPSPGPFLSFVSECLAFHCQQRSTSHPIVVHCLSGVGRTGLFCLTAAAVCEVQAGHGLIDLVKITGAMSQRRKGALRDREHLKFAYQSLLYYAQDILMKYGILTSRSSFEDKRGRSEGKCHTRHPSQDFLLGPPTGLSQLQSGIEKMGCPSPK